MKFFLVRHGESVWNQSKRVQGHIDVGLTERGREQARTFAHSVVFKNLPYEHAYSSDLIRAHHTAQILCHNMSIQTVDQLRERNFGRYQGQSWDEMFETYHAWEDLPESLKWTTRISDEETYQEVLERVLAFLETLATDGSRNRTALIVTHSGVLKALFLHLGGPEHCWSTVNGFDNLGFVHLEMDRSRQDLRLIDFAGAIFKKQN